jgi:hypothetical protein
LLADGLGLRRFSAVHHWSHLAYVYGLGMGCFCAVHHWSCLLQLADVLRMLWRVRIMSHVNDYA